MNYFKKLLEALSFHIFFFLLDLKSDCTINLKIKIKTKKNKEICDEKLKKFLLSFFFNKIT